MERQDKNKREIRYAVGDILDDAISGSCDYIGHQVNCVTRGARRLAHTIFEAYPEANNYAGGNKNVLGKAMIFGRIVNLAGQYNPGAPDSDNALDGKDTRANRMRWFRSALDDFLQQARKSSSVISIALPVNIGCGLAGGNWDDYHALLVDWHANNADVDLLLVRYEPK